MKKPKTKKREKTYIAMEIIIISHIYCVDYMYNTGIIALHVLTHLILTTPYQVGTILSPFYR